MREPPQQGGEAPAGLCAAAIVAFASTADADCCPVDCRRPQSLPCSPLTMLRGSSSGSDGAPSSPSRSCRMSLTNPLASSTSCSNPTAAASPAPPPACSPCCAWLPQPQPSQEERPGAGLRLAWLRGDSGAGLLLAAVAGAAGAWVGSSRWPWHKMLPTSQANLVGRDDASDPLHNMAKHVMGPCENPAWGA
jgi:hypothetical protein